MISDMELAVCSYGLKNIDMALVLISFVKNTDNVLYIFQAYLSTQHEVKRSY